MANTSSFLEPSSFMDVPPLRLIRKEDIALEHVKTLAFDGYFYSKLEHEHVCLEDGKLLCLDIRSHSVFLYKILEESPYLELFSSIKLGLPITSITGLSGDRFAGLVRTNTKKGIAIFELPAQATGERLRPKLFTTFEQKLSKLCSNGSELFAAGNVNDFLCLLTFSGDNLEIISTRPFSCVTKELVPHADISLLAISPDGAVVFAVDQGQSLLFRMEVVSGNCKSFSLSKGFSSVVTGLTFGCETVLLHHAYKTVVLTSMGITITTLPRRLHCVKASGNTRILFMTGLDGDLAVYKLKN